MSGSIFEFLGLALQHGGVGFMPVQLFGVFVPELFGRG